MQCLNPRHTRVQGVQHSPSPRHRRPPIAEHTLRHRRRAATEELTARGNEQGAGQTGRPLGSIDRRLRGPPRVKTKKICQEPNDPPNDARTIPTTRYLKQLIGYSTYNKSPFISSALVGKTVRTWVAHGPAWTRPSRARRGQEKVPVGLRCCNRRHGTRIVASPC